MFFVCDLGMNINFIFELEQKYHNISIIMPRYGQSTPPFTPVNLRNHLTKVNLKHSGYNVDNSCGYKAVCNRPICQEMAIAGGVRFLYKSIR